MQEQAEADIKEMIAAALSDPLISGKKRGVRKINVDNVKNKNKNKKSRLQDKKTGPEYAINKMTEEV